MCLLADMTVWCYHTEKSVPGIQLGAFADDRTIWCKGKHAREKLEKAVTVTEHYDSDAGWRWNEGKEGAAGRPTTRLPCFARGQEEDEERSAS